MKKTVKALASKAVNNHIVHVVEGGDLKSGDVVTVIGCDDVTRRAVVRGDGTLTFAVSRNGGD